MKCIVLAIAVLAGCIGKEQMTKPTARPVSADKTRYLCVGMERSSRFGACPGCEKDAKNLASLMNSRFGYSGEILISAAATKAAVAEKLRDGIRSTPEDGLFLFFYSGHGGQEYLGGKEPDGADGADEYLCLEDGPMIDDEIWDIVKGCRGRVFMYFDACHSATMYRSVRSDGKPREAGEATMLSLDDSNIVHSSGFTFRPEKFVTARASSSDEPQNYLRMLCWSGCRESEYSYGSNMGGTLTSSVLCCWRRGITYSALWNNARRLVVRSQPTQHPVETSVGRDFSSTTEAFR